MTLEQRLQHPTRNQAGQPLTTREIEVLRRVAEGTTSKEVARDLSLSKRTVDFHLNNAYRKLGANGRLKAINAARRAGVIE